MGCYVLCYVSLVVVALFRMVRGFVCPSTTIEVVMNIAMR